MYVLNNPIVYDVDDPYVWFVVIFTEGIESMIGS